MATTLPSHYFHNKGRTALIASRMPATVINVKALLILAASLCTSVALAEDWTTTDGKVYTDVKVVRVEDDAVTILCKNGGALVPIFKLNPTLQKRFSYDPEKAKAASAARSKEDVSNAKQLQAEIELAQKMKLQDQIAAAKQREQTQGTATGTH
jgi:hypothetical protein